MTQEETRPAKEDRAGTEIVADQSSTYVEQFNAAPLKIPAIANDASMLDAALAYAAAGWYILPVKRGTKHPGSVLGKGWQDRSSRDRKVIVAWFAGTDHGIALHCGRSGAVVFDVDHPDALPLVLAEAFQGTESPYQSTRFGKIERGHYIFLQPQGRTIGNGVGRLGVGWGEVRGDNGVIIVEPSEHVKAAEGGQYQWIRTGDVPALPDPIAKLLRDAGPTVPAADDPTVTAFLAEHTRDDYPELLEKVVSTFTEKVAAGASRHDTAVDVTCWALKEARAGYYPALTAVDRVEALFLAAVREEPGREDEGEWGRIIAYAVAAALADDTEARVAKDAARWAGGTDFDPTIGNDSDSTGAVPSTLATADPEPLSAHLVTGGAFIHDVPKAVPALWGRGEEVLWSEGEPLIVTGPPGVGKTTLGGNVIAGRLGLGDGFVLGYPVRPGARKTLLLAMDRPAQIQRALARLLRAYPRDMLDERLAVWKGPPPADLAKHPGMLLALAQDAEADTVVVDSLKDAAIKLSDEETGQGISRAMNHCVANGVEVLAYHHQTKRGAGGIGKPTSLADVYGSAWITAGAGSVLLLWGAAGDSIVELTHLKQPADAVGPLQVLHNHETGESSISEVIDLVKMASEKRQGLTANDAAALLFRTAKPTKNEVEKARRKLDALVNSYRLRRRDGQRGGSPATYHDATMLDLGKAG